MKSIRTSNTAGKISFRGLLALLRPRHWVKNLFSLAPLVFSGSFTRPGAVALSLAALLFLCVASSVGYLINDLTNRHRDALHATNRLTGPIATGIVGIGAAQLLLALLVTLVLLGYFISIQFFSVLLLYVIVDLIYLTWLKRVPVVDIFCATAGFVLASYGGALVIHVPLSEWMLVTTLATALYLAAIKRRNELAMQGSAGERVVLGEYSVALLDRFALMSSACAIVFYSMFVVTTRPVLAPTTPLVLFGIFRYWYLADRKERGQSTNAYWGDMPLVATIALWGTLCILLLRP